MCDSNVRVRNKELISECYSSKKTRRWTTTTTVRQRRSWRHGASCPARWKTVHSVKVSLLIVQVPVQTERLNPRGTNPARKSLIVRMYACTYPSSLCTCPRSWRSHVTETRSYHSNAGQEAPASLVLRLGISTRDCSALPPSFLLPCPSALSFTLEGPKRDARNKNNKKYFLPFRLYISHLALSSLSQSFFFDIFYIFPRSSLSVHLSIYFYHVTLHHHSD